MFKAFSLRKEKLVPQNCLSSPHFTPMLRPAYSHPHATAQQPQRTEKFESI